MKIAVAGATSAIAQAMMREAAAAGDSLFLIARSEKKLESVASDLRVRGATVVNAVADLDDISRHDSLLEEAERALGGLDVLVVAHGVLTKQAEAVADFSIFVRDLHTNFVSSASLAEAAARRFESRRSGVIAVLSSVAGDRGRQSNYSYGSSKSGLSAYLSGMRGRLLPSNVTVLDFRPGMVDTPMTAHLPKGPLFASAETVGKDLYRAIVKKKDVVYSPFFWCLIMGVIRALPELVFKRLKF